MDSQVYLFFDVNEATDIVFETISQQLTISPWEARVRAVLNGMHTPAGVCSVCLPFIITKSNYIPK